MSSEEAPAVADVPAAAPVRNRSLWLMALLPGGFMLGVFGGFLQQHRLEIGPVELPWAALLVLAALVTSIRAASLNLLTRWAGGLWYAGWLIATVLMAVPNPSGDVVFGDDVATLGYLLGGSLIGASAVFWPLLHDLPTAAPEVANG